MPTLQAVRSDFRRKGAWGLATSIDLFDCDPKIIRDARAVRRYLTELCSLIKMRPFRSPQVVKFGQDPRVAGFSFLQLIETSLISGHLSDKTNAAYIDIFSCTFYDFRAAALFSQKFFGAKRKRIHVIVR